MIEERKSWLWTSMLNKKHIRIGTSLILISLMIISIYFQGLSFTNLTNVINESKTSSYNGLPSTNDLINSMPIGNSNRILTSEYEQARDSVTGNPTLPETLDIGKLFTDNQAEYHKVWEPWLSKAGIHDIEVSPDGEFLVVGGGYLYDSEIHVYRWNDEIGQYVRAWESGDGIFNGDIHSVALADTDHNEFLELIGACGDGYVNVFEQTHVYDPFTQTETRFDHVWQSPYLGKVWGLEVADTDLDYVNDIIAGSFDGHICWYEYKEHSGYPFSKEHWIKYNETFRLTIDGHIQSIYAGDINANGLPDIVVGTQEGYIYVVENNGTVIDMEGVPFALPRDNNYDLIWENKKSIWQPIMKMDVGQLDNDDADEVVLVARGQGAYVLDYDTELEDYVLNKMVLPIESWEYSGAYPLDHWIDWMLSSSGDVYYYNGTRYDEPFSFYQHHAYPYNTSLAQETTYSAYNDGQHYYTTFDATNSNNASAIVDFGKDEAATGNGRPGSSTSTKGYDL
ncbi:MAG: hypothetical protein ACFFCQ_02440, partial [Promethearchaeota archaeon]